MLLGREKRHIQIRRVLSIFMTNLYISGDNYLPDKFIDLINSYEWLKIKIL